MTSGALLPTVLRAFQHSSFQPARLLHWFVFALQGKIKSLEQIFLFSLAVKEYQVGAAGAAQV